MLLIGRAHRRKSRALLIVIATILGWGVCSFTAHAAASISQSFQASGADIVPGALVSLSPGVSDTVELVSKDNAEHLIGVIGQDTPVTTASGTTVQVITSGTAIAMVSDINGAIKSGDKITISPLNGIGMKATTSGMVIGIAQGGLSSGSQTQVVKDKQSRDKQVHIGAVAVQVAPSVYKFLADQNTFLPSALQGFANQLIGHTVSPVRVMLASLLVLVFIVILAVLLYSGIRSSIISIGRNPLSKSSVDAALFQLGMAVIAVAAFGVIAVYFILTI